MSQPSDIASSTMDGWIASAIMRQLPEQRLSLSLEDAATLGRYACLEAQILDLPIVFSLVDASGQQRYFFSQDNALLVSQRLAFQKAWTAIALKMPTHELAPLVQPGASLYGLQHEKDICCFGGGVPCWVNGALVGAIGISGGSVEQDVAIASNTLRRFSNAHFVLTSSK
ncbi:GlcG/HbpS family heme-binding protein [Buttiauxella brennerae]|uniref:GlcG/HbpS family heme-binding protein n=1 Tax=Buttiauxella brennerae TaxID=82988 RepID=UPI00286F854D|nr:heme-binding protein [Buttiauxella brennerae]